MDIAQVMFSANVPVRLTLDDILLIEAALSVLQDEFATVGRLDEAAQYNAIIDKLQAASAPTLAVMAVVA